MAHNITIRSNGRAEMAFVGQTPWHGLGQQLTKEASIGVWQKEAGLDWEVFGAPMQTNPGPYSLPVPFPDHMGLYRSDTTAPLSVVGKDYKVVQPSEILEFFRDLVEHEGWHISTAGSLGGGRKVWALATNDEFAFVKPRGRDAITRNILLATSCDGSMRTTAMETTIRVVCANTLSLAVGDGRQKRVRISHRTEFDPDLVKRLLGLESKAFPAFMEKARELADTPINLSDARDVLRRVFGVEEAQNKSRVKVAWLGNLAEIDQEPEDERESRSVARILELFAGAAKGYDLAKDTRWGLLNAVTEFVDHEMGRSQDTRLDAAWFGRGAGFKQTAYHLLANMETPA